MASAHVIAERDPRRMRPAAGSIVLPVLLVADALARYPHQFHWYSTAAIVHLTVLAAMLLTGTVILVPGLPRAAWGRPVRTQPTRQRVRSWEVARDAAFCCMSRWGHGSGESGRDADAFR